MIYKIAIANTKKFVNSGTTQQFTLEDLRVMARTAEGVRVTQDFRNDTPAIGVVISAEVVGEELIAEIEAEIPKTKKPLYFVPAIEVGSGKLVEAAITEYPAMSGIPKIQQ